jgi:hypothetical protein
MGLEPITWSRKEKLNRLALPSMSPLTYPLPDCLQLISDVSRKVAKPIQPTIWLLYASCSYGKPKRNYDPVAYWHFAIRGGVEPPCCDSVRNNIAGFVVNPYPFTYFVICAPETRGCVCRAYAFHHLIIN